jgi:hypothetical protein
MNFKNYFATTILIVLLIWGPINHSWPAWIAIRIGYLLLIPFLIYKTIDWIWNYFDFSDKLDNILERILSVIISISLFTFAIIEATSKNHVGNTQSIQTRDGIEEVGEDIILQGPDWRNVLVLVIFAVIFFILGIKKDKIKK